MNKYYLLIQTLPTPIKISTLCYFSFSIGYCAQGSYSDSKKYLSMYRNNELNESDNYAVTKIKSEWDAVKYGAYVNFGERLWSSLIWPYSISTNIVPIIVLMLNPKKEN